MASMACSCVFCRPVVSASVVPSPAAAISGVMPLRVGAERRIGAVLEQQLHRRQVAGLGRAQERRRAAAEHSVVAAIELRAIRRQALLPRVDVGTALEREARHVEARQAVLDAPSAPGGSTSPSC